ncbi:mitochondrial mRNA pseudouridine synthase RPUSD3-like [Amphiura filiformis]|uniref:mitochondrial mRNA pseudouridine synthase RPUSD3-like n=1 Tax=Amphiura filiformis TaxID=82378 RepID=UPI003B2198DD
MNKSMFVLLRKFSLVSNRGYSNQTYGNLVQLQSIWASSHFQSCQCLCTNAHAEAAQKSIRQEEDSAKLKKKAKRARKKQLLDGLGSILKDPGVPVPQKMQQSDLIDCLVKSAVVQDNIIAISKPPGLPISGGQKSDDEVTFVSMLPEVAEAIGHPSAEIVTGPEREASGLLLLGHNKACAGELSEALSAAKKSKSLCRRYWAITVGIPSQEHGKTTVTSPPSYSPGVGGRPGEVILIIQMLLKKWPPGYFFNYGTVKVFTYYVSPVLNLHTDIISETIGFEKIGDQVLGVIRHDPSKASFKRKHVPSWKPSKHMEVNKKAETHYNVVCRNEELNCALVELKIHSACKHQLQVHLSHRLHPVLGDHIYSSRIGKILGLPVPLDPYEALPATQDIGPQLKQALLLRSGLIHMLPLHLHWYDVTLPKWKGNKDVCIRVPPPDYFWKTLQLLNLSPPLLQDS